MSPETSPLCPACGSQQVATIFYGLPSLDRLQPDLDAGRVVLGGCCLFENSPQWKCQACGHEWGRAQDLDELHRLRREAEALPKSLGRRLQAWIGISLEDEKTLLSGLARRVGWATAGVAVVFTMELLTSPWIGLAVLTIWWLPLLWNIALRLPAAGVCLGLVIRAVVVRPWNPRMPAGVAWTVGFLVVTCLEFILLILAFAYAGGSLLSEAMQPHTNRALWNYPNGNATLA